MNKRFVGTALLFIYVSFFFFQKQLKEQAVSKKSEQDEEQTKPDKKPKALLDRL